MKCKNYLPVKAVEGFRMIDLVISLTKSDALRKIKKYNNELNFLSKTTHVTFNKTIITLYNQLNANLPQSGHCRSLGHLVLKEMMPFQNLHLLKFNIIE